VLDISKEKSSAKYCLSTQGEVDSVHTMLQKFSLLCFSHLQTLHTELLVASQQKTTRKSRNHPKRRNTDLSFFPFWKKTF